VRGPQHKSAVLGAIRRRPGESALDRLALPLECLQIRYGK
jgi:hypothetical protein